MPFNLRPRSQFHIPPLHTVYVGTGSIEFLRIKIWGRVTDEIKKLEGVREFIKALKQWKPTLCPFRLCKRYIYRIGFN